jgi:hypothetical protein
MMELYAKEKTQLHATAKNWSYLGFEIRNAKTRPEGSQAKQQRIGLRPRRCCLPPAWPSGGPACLLGLINVGWPHQCFGAQPACMASIPDVINFEG